MIDGLIAGKLYGAAQSRTGQCGKTFVTAMVRTATGDGESLLVNVIAFHDGDSVALAGALTPKVWVDKSGDAKPALDIVAHGALAAYHVQHERKAVQFDEATTTGGTKRAICGGYFSDMQDDL
ncbi:hypothetical protein R75461_07673 [Paraburkholderia nemoris]|uniref:single-stranded DNA-binding protein n=1 Tax=Paraburkholderia nemoris TaxID=2793076 RepID=UPI00190CC193|nr:MULTISPECIES: single-stranded DNA-binding protein [Paraburkholderia]MBK3786435.1 single-stranded DNA-binding protein [Paraburkholderia aspalathi]CAE6855252.1 hypothetical protein R75461_07673 [Paraburkholderia nemoris]